jgi:hypothetical protein
MYPLVWQLQIRFPSQFRYRREDASEVAGEPQRLLRESNLINMS